MIGLTLARDPAISWAGGGVLPPPLHVRERSLTWSTVTSSSIPHTALCEGSRAALAHTTCTKVVLELALANRLGGFGRF